jgi:hypothetical protein
MRHPTDGALRRLLDEPAGVADADREHAAGCERCLTALAGMRADAGLVRAALAAEPTVDLAGAWQRLSAAGTPARRVRVRRRRAYRPAVAGLAVAVALAGAGTAAANDWLPVFRTERVAPVGVGTADLLALPDLDAYGTLTETQDPDLHRVAGAEQAAAETGLAAPRVTALPRGITGEPVWQVGRRVSAVFTFSAAKAVAAGGKPVPAGLDGTRVRLTAGPGLAAVWPAGSGVPALAVGRAVAPTAASTGVPFATLRDYLLSLPGLPVSVATQLRTYTADGTTLPLPVDSDRFRTGTATVGGVPATTLATRDGTLAAVLWVRDGVLTAVAGALDVAEVVAVAQGLG